MNKRRIRFARAALRGYRLAGHYKDTAETDLIDLITDVYHLAQSEDVDVEVIARQALAHFKAELIADTSETTKEELAANFGDGKAQVGGNEDVK